MKAILKKCLCLLLTAGLLASLAACAGQTDTAVVKDLFGDLQKVSYSSTYTSLRDNKTNKTDSWRQGMVSGNGLDPAGLYRTLKRMETAGLVTSYWDTESASKPRRVYSITDEGRHCLSAWEKTLLEYRSNIDAILRGILSAEEL